MFQSCFIIFMVEIHLIDPLHKAGNDTHIHPSPRFGSVKQKNHVTIPLFSCTKVRQEVYLHIISSILQRVYTSVLGNKKRIQRGRVRKDNNSSPLATPIRTKDSCDITYKTLSNLILRSSSSSRHCEPADRPFSRSLWGGVLHVRCYW